jgi:putative transcriptional regulator
MEERDDDWRAFRAKLVKSQDVFLNPSSSESDDGVDVAASADPASWAHVLAAPEQGCLLLANPLMFTTSQTYFNKAIILLFGHGADGSAGVIINKQTQHVMVEFKDSSTLPDAYDACPLYLGGDVGPEVLHIVHTVEGVDNTTSVVPGVYMGGVDGVGRALEEGRAGIADVKLLTRYAGWGPGQLEEEVRRGVWIVAAASRDVIMGRLKTADGMESDEVVHGDDAWHSILQAMGGEFAGLSDAVQEEYREDIMVVGSDDVEDDAWISDDVPGAEGPGEDGKEDEEEEGGPGRDSADGADGKRGGSTGDYSI